MKRSTLTLAITLAFSFTAAPADALLTGGQKCAMQANLLSGKFSLCLNKADANVAKGRLSDTAAADAKCESKFRDGWDKVRTKAQEKDADNGNAEELGADCGGAMTDAVRDSVEASALIALGRDLTVFAVNELDLAEGSGVKAMVDAALATCPTTTCGNGELEAGEDCEVAWTSGTVFDTGANCLDIGFDAGSLVCGAGCVYDTSGCRDQVCGDGILDAPEGCDDGNIVGGDGCDPTCIAEAACVSDATICDDGNPCTIDSCDPGQGCVHVDEMDGEPCDDGNACSLNDVCSSGSCTSTQQLECDDQKVCTTDTCNEISGCVYTSTCSHLESCEVAGCVPTGPCGNYVTVNQIHRRDYYHESGNYLCDSPDLLPENTWFRLTDSTYRYVRESPPNTYRCGTMAPIWMEGSHPTRAQGIVQRRLCARWNDSTCQWSSSINVLQCSGYFVYRVPSLMPNCYTSLCSTQTEPATLN